MQPFVESELKEATSEFDVFRHLEFLTERYGFDSFALVALPASDQRSLEDSVVAGNWPSAFITEYDAMRPFKGAPLFARLRNSTAPATWSLSENTNGFEDEDRPARALFLRFGFRTGIAVPLHGAGGGRAAMLFAGERKALSRRELADLVLSAILAYDLYDRLKHKDDEEPARLSDRELQVLGWVANGKTSVEIATILSLSDHTVNSYLNSAMRKFNCVNRTQLTAKAIRLRLIS